MIVQVSIEIKTFVVLIVWCTYRLECYMCKAFKGEDE